MYFACFESDGLRLFLYLKGLFYFLKIILDLHKYKFIVVVHGSGIIT